MTDLIAWISSGKGTIAHVQRVIEGQEWEKIVLLTTEEYKNQTPSADNTEIIVVNKEQTLTEMTHEIKNALQGKVSIMETAVNLISGEGKEHMALLSALLQLGCGIRLVALTREGVKEV